MSSTIGVDGRGGRIRGIVRGKKWVEGLLVLRLRGFKKLLI